MDIEDIIKVLTIAGEMNAATRKACELANSMDYAEYEEKRDELMEAVRFGVESVRALMQVILGESTCELIREESKKAAATLQ